MRTSRTSANGRGASFPGFGLSANRDIRQGRELKFPKHERCGTWPQKPGHPAAGRKLTLVQWGRSRSSRGGPQGAWQPGRPAITRGEGG